MADKDNAVYIPVLQAFIDKANQAYEMDSDMPQKLVEYLMRTSNDSKIVCNDGKCLMVAHAFDTYRTLKQPCKIKETAVTVPGKVLPTELIALKVKTDSTNTVEMYLNNGWQLEFRVQDTDAKSKQRFKLEARLVGMPVSIPNIECR